jgi:MazG family protein
MKDIDHLLKMGALKEELGDLLFQIIFYCQMSSESGEFNFADIVTKLNEKMVRRHPHVFADETIATASEQSLSWERIKDEERKAKGNITDHLLDGISSALPALIHAMKLQKKAATVGFDWDSPGPVLDKIEEELSEIREEVNEDIDIQKLQDEIGDVLFAVVNFARHHGIDAETALMKTNRKFKKRFEFIESHLEGEGRTLDDADLDEMETLWQKAKKVRNEE